MRDVNDNLGNQLTAATQMSDHLKRQLSECDHVVRRLSKIAIAARPQNAVEPETATPAPRQTSCAEDFRRQGGGGRGAGIL